jgi:glycosyltransferase involved in cell wall biosynthesis
MHAIVLSGALEFGRRPPTADAVSRLETEVEMVQFSRNGSPSGLRILVAHNVPRGRTGGMNRTMGFIHDRVASHGHTVDEFTADDAPSYARGRWDRFGFPWAVYRHALEANRLGRGYDLINVHEPSAAVVAGLKHRLGHPVIVVTTYGVEQRGWELGLEELRLGRPGPSWISRLGSPATRLWQSRLALRWADHIFCKNSEDLHYIVQRFDRQPDEITRLFPGAGSAYIDAYPRRNYDATGGVVFFGTWLARKGTIDLVPAFVELATRQPDLKLTVMGAGIPKEAVLRSFPDHLHNRIVYVPQVPAEEYAERMLGAAVYVIPSLFEGTPLTLMEAMATGLPAVGTATCGMKDVINDGVNGLLVPLRDPAALVEALGRILSDRGLRERLGRQAHADVVENYTWDLVADPIRKVYERLAKQRGEP